MNRMPPIIVVLIALTTLNARTKPSPPQRDRFLRVQVLLDQAHFSPGEIAGLELQVPNIHHDPPGTASAVSVSKSKQTVEALDAAGKALAAYPATIGSAHDPLPIGSWKVTHITHDPVFFYDPNLFWNASES